MSSLKLLKVSRKIVRQKNKNLKLLWNRLKLEMVWSAQVHAMIFRNKKKRIMRDSGPSMASKTLWSKPLRNKISCGISWTLTLALISVQSKDLSSIMLSTLLQGRDSTSTILERTKLQHTLCVTDWSNPGMTPMLTTPLKTVSTSTISRLNFWWAVLSKTCL